MIDVKELRIGSRVKFNGKRAKVRGIGADFVSFDGECVFDHEIFPIPITPELLAELGFEYRERSKSWLYRLDDDNMLFIQKAAKYGWRVTFYPQDYHMEQAMLVSSLHELEAMYYHVFKKELIEE